MSSYISCFNIASISKFSLCTHEINKSNKCYFTYDHKYANSIVMNEHLSTFCLYCAC